MSVSGGGGGGGGGGDDKDKVNLLRHKGFANFRSIRNLQISVTPNAGFLSEVAFS